MCSGRGVRTPAVLFLLAALYAARPALATDEAGLDAFADRFQPPIESAQTIGVDVVLF